MHSDWLPMGNVNKNPLRIFEKKIKYTLTLLLLKGRLYDQLKICEGGLCSEKQYFLSLCHIGTLI